MSDGGISRPAVARRGPRRAPLAGQAGFSLLEILVTVVIIAFGLLGAAGLQMKMIAEDQESFQRAQALLLLEDMQNRISANRVDAQSYVTATPVGTDDGIDCTAPGTLALRDLCEWGDLLRGRAEALKEGDRVGAMLGARGCVEQIGLDPLTLRVTVAWQGMSAAGASPLGCATGLYGSDDGFRRAVSTRVAFGVLE